MRKPSFLIGSFLLFFFGIPCIYAVAESDRIYPEISQVSDGEYAVGGIRDDKTRSGSYGSGNTLEHLVYPSGDDFHRLKEMLDRYFVPSTETFGEWGMLDEYSMCTVLDRYCPNYRYTRIAEQALKLLVARTYKGNEKFYAHLFAQKYMRMIRADYSDENVFNLAMILQQIPRGTSAYADHIGDAHGGYADVLMDASFGVDFGETPRFGTLLYALEQKIETMQTAKCRQMHEYDIDCYEYHFGQYLPTPEELMDETLFLEGKSVQIRDREEEFVYTVSGSLTEKDGHRYYASGATYVLDYKKTHYNSDEARRYVAEKTAHLSEPVKKDYTSLLMGKTIPEIPSVFRLIPSDALVLYIPQPKQFFDFLKDKQYSLLDLMGLNMYGTVQFYMKKFLSIEDGARFESLLQHEVAVVLPRMDMVAPTVVLLVRDADRRILEVMDKELVKRDIEDWTIIAPSEQILDAFISPQQTLADAPDFQYVWEKKSHRIQDAFIFAGDQFFENITHLEYFISMQRRYKLYEQLVQLQQLVWAYEDAFGSAPSSLSAFQDIGLETLAHEALAGFSLEGNRVRHATLGFIDHIYPSGLVDSLEMITRDELDAYLNSIFSYREVWTESLDPMGIVLNTYQDGVEVEFFMTPVPDLENTSFSWIQTLFKHTTKKRLDVLGEQGLRLGIFSLMFGMDPSRVAEYARENSDVGESIRHINTEVFEGTSVLSLLGGEIVLSLGSIDRDIFDGWNPKKLDAYIALQMRDTESGKIFVEKIRSFFLKEIGKSSDIVASFGKFLSQPLVENYRDIHIYYGEDMPFFIGSVDFAYAFVDNFLVLGLNRDTIKRVIDVEKDGEPHRNAFIDGVQSDGTFWAMVLNSASLQQDIVKLYQTQGTSWIYRLQKEYGLYTFFWKKIARAYAKRDIAERLGQEIPAFEYRVGSSRVSLKDKDVLLDIDTDLLRMQTGLSGGVLDMLLEQAYTEFHGTHGVQIRKFPSDTAFSLFLLGASTLFGGDDGFVSILPNVSFQTHYAHDEIGFTIRIFSEISDGKNTASSTQTESWGWIVIGGGMACVVGALLLFSRARHRNSDAHSAHP